MVRIASAPCSSCSYVHDTPDFCTATASTSAPEMLRLNDREMMSMQTMLDVIGNDVGDNCGEPAKARNSTGQACQGRISLVMIRRCSFM